METLTRLPELEQKEKLEVGQLKLVRRRSGAIMPMEITGFTESEATFDEHNHPTDERLVHMVGSSPELITTDDGDVLGLPQKTIAEEFLTDDYQAKLQAEIDNKYVDKPTIRAVGKGTIDTYQIPIVKPNEQ